MAIGSLVGNNAFTGFEVGINSHDAVVLQATTVNNGTRGVAVDSAERAVLG